MTNIKLRLGKRSGRLALLTLTPIMAALVTVAPTAQSAVLAPVKASVKYDKKQDRVIVTGSVSKAITPNSKVSVYDTANQVLLYSVNTNSTGKFKMWLPTTGKGYVPCAVRLESVNAADNKESKIVIPVAGASGCATALACTITSPIQDIEIPVGTSQSFTATTKKSKTPPTLVWKPGDGSADLTGATASHTYDQVGRYRVTLNANMVDTKTNATKTCSDDVIVSVTPTAGTNPNRNLADDITKTPIASAMPKLDGSNDVNAYVVLPFEEMGMQGGSQIHLPYNAMINYNSLNAQVIQKKEHKPPIVSNSSVDVSYSAASNDMDPIAKNSINSTSQNLFASDVVGTNWDVNSSIFSTTTQLPNNVQFIAGQEYNKASIRKTEQWDRVYQPSSTARNLEFNSKDITAKTADLNALKDADKIILYTQFNPTDTDLKAFKLQTADQKVATLLDLIGTGKIIRYPQNGATFAEKQNTYTPAKPVEKPDEGVKSFADNGAASRKMPGISKPYVDNKPQPFDYYGNQSAFVAQFIPASDIDDQGRTNPYPLMRVQAKDKSTGDVVATTDAVYTTASETRCRECHTPGGIAANEYVWRTPVTVTELKDLTDSTKPGPATGAGRNERDSKHDGKAQISGFTPGIEPNKPWAPAIHNLFNNKIDGNTSFTNLGVTVGALDPATGTIDPATGKVDPKTQTKLPTSVSNIETDQNDLRKDRVKASRWAKFDPATDKPTGETQPTKPAAADTDPSWRLQVQLNFADASKYGDDSWVNQEKAALFNTLIMHDYMVYYGPTPATSTSDWPASYSTQVADSYADDVGKNSRVQPMYFCSGHHQSALKADVGVNGRTYPTNRSDYSRAFHAFHGKMQVYKKDVSATDSADGSAHTKGDLIRDVRGHPLEYGGRGWDSQLNDDNGVDLKIQADGKFTDVSVKGMLTKDWPGFYIDSTTTPGTLTPKSPFYAVPNYLDPSKNNWDEKLYPKDSNGTSMLPFGKDVPIEENCAKCHTGPTEKGYRDIHHTAGLKCDSCHGDMLAVGNVFGNEQYNANLTGGGAYGKDNPVIDPTDFRRPWLDEPNCGSCHIGDANMSKSNKHLFSAAALDQAWQDGDKTGYTMDPMNARFAVMPTLEDRPEKLTATAQDVADGYKGLDGKTVAKGETFYKPTKLSGALYRKSADVHGSSTANGALTCSTCHGGSHAIWPNQDPNANDNQTAKQLQGYDGNIAECSVCHIKDDFKTGLVATDGGEASTEFPNGAGVGQGIRAGTVVTPAGLDVNGKPGKFRTATAYLAGPHGLHPVGDESWYKHAEGAAENTSTGKHNSTQNGGWHNDMAKMPGPDGEDQCAACHGDDHKGTRLSKTLRDRTLFKANGKEVKVFKGQIIGCDLCHTIAKSFTGSKELYHPKKAPTGGWPQPLMHMPPSPKEFYGTGGAGGMGM